MKLKEEVVKLSPDDKVKVETKEMKVNKPKRKKKSLNRKQTENLAGWSFVAIWVVGFALFMGYPLIMSIIYSFNKVTIVSTGVELKFIGFTNYLNIFKIEQGLFFLESLKSFFWQIITQVPIIIAFSIIIAVLLNMKIKGRGIFRSIFFLPVIIASGPVITELIREGASGSSMIDNYSVLALVEEVLPEFLATPVSNIFKNIIIIFWFSGVQILIVIAGLQKIDASIYEAASIDGASPWEAFWKITLPALKSIIFVNVIYTIVLLSTFSTNETIMVIRSNMFKTDQGLGYGFSSAIAWVYSIIVLLFLGIAALLFKNKKDKKAAVLYANRKR